MTLGAARAWELGSWNNPGKIGALQDLDSAVFLLAQKIFPLECTSKDPPQATFLVFTQSSTPATPVTQDYFYRINAAQDRGLPCIAILQGNVTKCTVVLRTPFLRLDEGHDAFNSLSL